MKGLGDGNEFTPRSIKNPVIVGFGLGLFCLLVAFLMTGGGHGWLTPFIFSVISLFLYPAAFYVKENRSNIRSSILLLLLGAAAILDLLLYLLTRSEGVRYFKAVGWIAYLWIAVWAIWQLVLIGVFCQRLKRPKI